MTENPDQEIKGDNVRMFGIQIDTSAIKTVNSEDQNKDLSNLDIAVYEQEQFEDGIIHQVDTALSNAEQNFKRKIVVQEINQVTKELRSAQDEKDDIDKIFQSARQGDSEATRRISFSLLQQKQSKENQIKRLEEQLKLSKEQLNQVKHVANGSSDYNDFLGLNERQTELIRLGDITPFDALEKQRKSDEGHQNQPSSSKSDFQNGSNVTDNVLQDPALNLSHKSSTDLKVKRKHGSQSSDDEYVPEYESLSSDDAMEMKEKEKKAVKVDEKSTKKKSGKKRVIDDGDFNAFRERMRKRQVKKKLKEASHNGEVAEPYDSSDFSDDNSDNDEDDASIEDDFVLPRKIWNKLYKYQRVGVRWLWQLHKQMAGGIIGDEMGLGKTIQVIAFLVGLYYSKEKQSSSNRNSDHGLEAVLIVCPATVMHHWVAEFHKWWPAFRVGILHDSGSFTGKKPTLIRALNNHPGILITSYAGVRLNKKELMRYQWQYVILDEGHKIRNPDSDVTLACKQFDTGHRLILTGTPMQNSLKELWSLFDYVYPGKLGTLPVFMAEFSVPITMGGYANASTVQVQTAYRCSCVLRDTISPFILRRMKKDVQSSINLPSKSEQVLFCKFTEEQKTMYTEYINSKDVEQMLTGKMKVFAGLIKLRKICNHPDLGCFDQDNEENKSTSADVNNGTDQSKGTKGGFGFWKRSGKMIVVESLLRIWKEQGHRVLLFSQSVQMLNILENFLQAAGYQYSRMDGTTNIAIRQKMVNTYNEDKSIFVFILTTRVGGLGLNLTGANRVIIYDPDWNPSTDSQARERSWRIGQEREVTIYRLMTTGTIEEKIYHRQIFKQFLTNRVLTNPFQRRFFKSNDLYELFTLGDVGPMQSTETGAIFAGTGSEIRLRKKSKKSKSRAERTVDFNIKQTIDKHGDSRTLEHGKTDTQSNNIASSSHQHTESENDSSRHETKNTDILKKENVCTTDLTLSNRKHKKEKRKRKKKNVQVDGVTMDSIDKSELYKKETVENEKKETPQSENDVLMSLFRSSGLHSALKHDRIVQAGNPDYVLVEKEAEKVAKQAVNALRQSRADCRKNGYTVPTWTGSKKPQVTPAKKPRFGAKKKSDAGITSKLSSEVPVSHSLNLEGETVDISSTALLARMRSRNMSSAATSTAGTSSRLAQTTYDSKGPEEVLMKDIQAFVSQRRDGVATTDEVTSFFSSRLESGQNALFKELLKQLCLFKRKDGVGTWKMRPEFLTIAPMADVNDEGM